MAGTPMTMVVDPGEAGPDKPAKPLMEQASDLRKASSQAGSSQVSRLQCGACSLLMFLGHSAHSVSKLPKLLGLSRALQWPDSV